MIVITLNFNALCVVMYFK